ncbi:glycosyltransferase family 2 protein [Neolewinella antarctica]|uniref:Glycosyltransferase involved in cell wall biosynthesis n=1 Tax=Neolewinella antarctica TaxID=442734 RepID=A0ABX0XH73_9BACT|nr:glycosyltransferase [Neolewinella antarctica]NJC28128.1 glycosyltransferase involved in cell wall biosynthesis [Neolewinella antarctica]
MLSICVPSYEYDVAPLVLNLRTQMARLDVPCELLVYDDASPRVPGWWEERAKLTGPGIELKRLPQNLGRAAIRNRLVRDARYPNVLLLDADGWPGDHFLQNYLRAVRDHRTAQNLLLIGGRTYAPSPPADPDLHLHWWYGHRRESTGHAHRRDPFAGFQSNNFLASRQLLLDHSFPETAVGYGHEDTLWGQQLRDQDITLARIDNPVIHLGLEPANTFLSKQHQAIDNLVRLRVAHPFLTTSLTRLTDRAPFAPFLARLLPERWLVRYLTGRPRPNLRALDILKLSWYNSGRPA